MYILGNFRGVAIFNSGKYYDGSPEYVAVKGNETIILCRMLLKSERLSQFDEITFLISEKDIKNGITKGKPCIILKHLNSMEEADRIVDSYQCTVNNFNRREVI